MTRADSIKKRWFTCRTRLPGLRAKSRYGDHSAVRPACAVGSDLLPAEHWLRVRSRILRESRHKDPDALFTDLALSLTGYMCHEHSSVSTCITTRHAPASAGTGASHNHRKWWEFFRHTTKDFTLKVGIWDYRQRSNDTCSIKASANKRWTRYITLKSINIQGLSGKDRQI